MVGKKKSRYGLFGSISSTFTNQPMDYKCNQLYLIDVFINDIKY